MLVGLSSTTRMRGRRSQAGSPCGSAMPAWTIRSASDATSFARSTQNQARAARRCRARPGPRWARWCAGSPASAPRFTPSCSAPSWSSRCCSSRWPSSACGRSLETRAAEPAARRRRTSASTGRSRSSTRWRGRCTSRRWRCCRRTRRRSPGSCARTTASTRRWPSSTPPATAEQRELVEQVRASQDEAMAVVADIANAIRDGKLGDVTRDLLAQQERARHRDHGAGRPAGRAEQQRMARLRDSVAARQPPLADPHRGLRRRRGRCSPGCAASSSRGRSSCRCARRRASSASVAAGDFSGASTCPTATSSARWPRA